MQQPSKHPFKKVLRQQVNCLQKNVSYPYKKIESVQYDPKKEKYTFDSDNLFCIRDDCKKYSYLPQCYKEPPCPQTCLDAAAKEQCPSQCEQFKGTKECCFECPTKCKEAYDDGKLMYQDMENSRYFV